MNREDEDALVALYRSTEFIRHLTGDNRVPTPEDRAEHAVRWTCRQSSHCFDLPEGCHLALVEMEEVE